MSSKDHLPFITFELVFSLLNGIPEKYSASFDQIYEQPSV